MTEAYLAISRTWDGRDALSHPSSITLSLSTDSNDINVEITAPFHDNLRPEQPCGRTDQLWDYEVVELFIASASTQDPKATPYTEIIVNPHGHWLVFEHTGEQNWSETKTTYVFPEQSAPVMTIDRHSMTWHASVRVPLQLLPHGKEEAARMTWKMNAYQIYNDPCSGERVYAACESVPGEVPAFHQLKYFKEVSLQKC